MIRQFENKDLTTVMDIWLSGNLQAHYFIDKAYWRQNCSAVAKMILQAEVYVYEENEVVVGFAGLEGSYIAGIFVRKDKQSCGIGREILDFLKSKFSKLNLSVYRKNNRALAFYLRENFQIVEEGIDDDTGEEELTLKWSAV